MIEKELESKDIETRLMILDAMEVRINSIIEERAKLKLRVDKLEEELDEYKEKITHIEEKEAECQKLRMQLEKRIQELVM